MTFYLPRGHFIVSFLTPEYHAGFGVNGYVFHEHGFDTVYRAMNFMHEVDALSPRLWAVDYSTDPDNPRIIPLHRLIRGRTAASESTSGLFANTEAHS